MQREKLHDVRCLVDSTPPVCLKRKAHDSFKLPLGCGGHDGAVCGRGHSRSTPWHQCKGENRETTTPLFMYLCMVILVVEAFAFSWSSDFLEEGQLQSREGRKVPMSEMSSLPEGFNHGLVGCFWKTFDEQNLSQGWDG